MKETTTTESLLNALPRHSQPGAVLPNDSGWMTRHFDAVTKYAAPEFSHVLAVRYAGKAEHERALILMLQGWLAYADAHTRAFGGIEECPDCKPEHLDPDNLNEGINCTRCNNTGKVEYGRIADDGVLGVEWLDIGKALRGLLNGELGRLDSGTLDGVLLKAMAVNGVDLIAAAT